MERQPLEGRLASTRDHGVHYSIPEEVAGAIRDFAKED
jgi:hypothetical protein